MKVIAVIVTYNRLELFQKCLSAVNAQTKTPDEVIVINNGSTDGTLTWLEKQPVTCYDQENKGGAGGFSYGINQAYLHGADWIWLMDDDTIPEPEALANLLIELENVGEQSEKAGFLSSNVYWTDGSLHEMNRTYVLKDKKKLIKIAWPEQTEQLIQFGTFVSMLLSTKAVKHIGLPIKEYFIWNEDVEYTKRIINAGMAGLLVVGSRVLHQTPVNHQTNVFKDSPDQLWKYRYGLRNELFTRRLHEGELSFWITWLHRMLLMPFRIALNRKDHRWLFTKIIWQTSLAALRFRPKIEWVNN